MDPASHRSCRTASSSPSLPPRRPAPALAWDSTRLRALCASTGAMSACNPNRAVHASRSGCPLISYRHTELRFGLPQSKLLLDFNAAPEGNVILDVTGSWLWIGIIPGSVGVLLAVNQQAVIARLSLPRAGQNRRTGADVIP